MISKELLNIVVKDYLQETVEDTSFKKDCVLCLTKEHVFEISYDKLQRLCKEWCIVQGYDISTSYNRDVESWESKSTECLYTKERIPNMVDVSELQLVLNVTEWVSVIRGYTKL